MATKPATPAASVAADPAPAAPEPIIVPAPASPAVEACKRDRIKEVLAYAAVATMILVVLLVFLKGLPTDQAALVTVGGMITAILLNVKEVYGFVFGSSQGSQDKNTQIAAMTPPAPTTQA